MRKRSIPLGVILPPLAVLMACEGPSPVASYHVDRACTDVGFDRGTAAYNACVADQRLMQTRLIYDLAIREAMLRPTEFTD